MHYGHSILRSFEFTLLTFPLCFTEIICFANSVVPNYSLFFFLERKKIQCVLDGIPLRLHVCTSILKLLVVI
jgi:hypothetical protein